MRQISKKVSELSAWDLNKGANVILTNLLPRTDALKKYCVVKTANALTIILKEKKYDYALLGH